MGRQINFYMDEATEKEFVEYVMKEGQILFEGNNSSYIIIRELPKPELVDWWFEVLLYKPSFGELCINNYSGRYKIDKMKSPVIEFSRTVVRDNVKQISCGRLWMSLDYYEGEQIQEKSKELYAWFLKLSRWIRKKIPKTEIKRGKYVYTEYISSTYKTLMEKGYKIV